MNIGDGEKSSKIRLMFPIITILAISILVTSAINHTSLYSNVETNTKEYLNYFADNLLLEIRHLHTILDTTTQTLNEKHIAIARSLADILENIPARITPEELKRLAFTLNIIELNIVSPNGILTASNNPDLIGFDYRNTETTSKYMGLLDRSAAEIIEEPRESIRPDAQPGDMNHYVGVPLSGGRGFIQIGFNVDVITKLREEINIEKIIAEQKIGRNGYGIVLSEGIVLAAPTDALGGKNVADEDWYAIVTSGDGFAWITIDDERYYAGYKYAYNTTVVGLVPAGDYYGELNLLLVQTVLSMLTSIFVIIVSLHIWS